MVDHNEMSQAIDGVENYRMRAVIDHHRQGNISTAYPITFINQPVGATCTIITNLYRQERVPMRKEIASILLCGILADTLSLKSATTTDTDRETAEYLARVTTLNLEELGEELRDAMNQIGNRSLDELIAQDYKEYNEGNIKFSVSQLETSGFDALLSRKDEFIAALEKTRAKNDLGFSALMVTDTTALNSILFMADTEGINSAANFSSIEGDIPFLKGVVSRKKQLIPLLTELLRKMG
jgi:manganese-dependent inorganic pyrophosphatase